MTTEYQVLARRFRPKTFAEVFGQTAVVTTLKNAIKHRKLAHAYLFCGSRGTGKTTLARIFAKSLNCLHPTADHEPCNACSCCKEISAGHSLDVLEIDGASNRGIDDIRQINETVGYTTASGNYKIYIIDEVHMLTKEAFNALLKTLEEPPPKVKFLFATTEPHKVLPTILSRCQRFNLNRIPVPLIIEKLQKIAAEMGVQAEEDALRLIADRAEGGLRDAESLFDQVLAFHETTEISASTVASILGVVPRDTFFELDLAGKEGRLAAAFEVAERLFSEGKDLVNFIEMLTEHFRNLLIVKLAGSNSPALSLSEADKARYEQSAKLYRKDQCLALIDYLMELQNTIRFAPSIRIALEAALLHILRSHFRVPVDILIQRLTDLESKIQEPGSFPAPPTHPSMSPLPAPTPQPPAQPLKPSTLQKPPAPAASQSPIAATPSTSISIDPHPTPADLGFTQPPQPNRAPPPKGADPLLLTPQQQSRYDTVMQFAAVELEGTLQKNRKK